MYSIPGTTLVVYEKTQDGKILKATISSGTPPELPEGYEYAVGAEIFNLSNGQKFVNEGSSETPSFSPSGQEAVATVDGTGTGQIGSNASYVTVTSDDANKIITLPAPVVGKSLVINVGATGFELRSTSPTTIAINGGTGADAESAIAADSTCFLTCISATAWKGFFMDADGDVAKIEPAA